MDVIKVDAIDSTNTFLRNLNRDRSARTPVCVMAKSQYAGKGQMGATWESEPGQNLICSVFLPVTGMSMQRQFYMAMVASLAVCDLLELLAVPRVAIKWPNDILSDQKKICGILIENSSYHGKLTGSIIGIGLNVNQTEFLNLPRAGSLRMGLGRRFVVDDLLESLLELLEARFELLMQGQLMTIKSDYEGLLFRRDKPATFCDAFGNKFTGIIKAVAEDGKLEVLLEGEVLKAYDLKQLRFLY